MRRRERGKGGAYPTPFSPLWITCHTRRRRRRRRGPPSPSISSSSSLLLFSFSQDEEERHEFSFSFFASPLSPQKNEEEEEEGIGPSLLSHYRRPRLPVSIPVGRERKKKKSVVGLKWKANNGRKLVSGRGFSY